ncbi:MAG: oligosaccharide flippase family protein [Armatimonadetes bacterium]|nr:oligosaccharide flippase family protein [Armatimonadota bacterium]
MEPAAPQSRPRGLVAKYEALASRYPMGQRLARGGFWALAGSVISQGMAFAASIACARLLGQTTYGELGMVRSTVATLGLFAGMGLGLTGLKHIAEFRDTDPARAGRIIRLCSVVAIFSCSLMAVGLVVSAPLVAHRMLANAGLTVPLLLGAALLFATAYDGAQKGILAGFEAYREIAQVSALGGAVLFALVLVGVHVAQLNGAILGYVAGSGFTLILNRVAIRRQCLRHGVPLGGRGFWQERGVLVSFSLPALLSGVVCGPAVWACNALLVNQPGGYGQMGILSACDQVKMLAAFIPASVMQCLLPVLSGQFGADGQAPLGHRLRMVNAYLAICALGVITGLLLFFLPTVLAIFGRDFGNGRVALVIALCVLLPDGYKRGITRLLQARGLVWLTFASDLAVTVVLLGAAVFLVRFGAAGIALATLLGVVAATIVFTPIAYHALGLTRWLKHDALVVGLLTLALAPGIWANLYGARGLLWAGALVLSLALFAVAVGLVWHWLRRPPQDAPLVEALELLDADVLS